MLPSKKTPTDFPFRHSGNPDKYGQSLGGDFAQVQANFDKRAEFNQAQINAILDALVSTTDGDSGADNIAVTAILGITAGNVQQALEGIKNYIDSNLSGIVLGQIPDDSLTDTKLASDIKIGSLSSLLTVAKNNVISAINEIYAMFANYMAKDGGAFTGAVAFSRNEVQQPKIKDYSETVKVIATATGAMNLDLSEGNVFDITLTGAFTPSFTNPAASGQAHSFTILLRQGATAYAVTWPASVKWSGDTIPTISDTNKTVLLSFVTLNGGTRWYGTAITKFTT